MQIYILKISHAQHTRQNKTGNVFRPVKSLLNNKRILKTALGVIPPPLQHNSTLQIYAKKCCNTRRVISILYKIIECIDLEGREVLKIC